MMEVKKIAKEQEIQDEEKEAVKFDIRSYNRSDERTCTEKKKNLSLIQGGERRGV